MEYGVIGKEVNIAARLEANSEPNRILVSESTANLVRGEFLVQERGEINLKGIDQPVRTFLIDA